MLEGNSVGVRKGHEEKNGVKISRTPTGKKEARAGGWVSPSSFLPAVRWVSDRWGGGSVPDRC